LIVFTFCMCSLYHIVISNHDHRSKNSMLSTCLERQDCCFCHSCFWAFIIAPCCLVYFPLAFL
jgi:hypothetical protein